jgi:hypothetical protein
MSERISESRVRFRAPFSIKGVEGVLPAGTYRIVTEEAAIDDLTFVAYRRVSTAIAVPIGVGSEEMTTIDPKDLEAALERDRPAVADVPPPERGE